MGHSLHTHARAHTHTHTHRKNTVPTCNCVESRLTSAAFLNSFPSSLSQGLSQNLGITGSWTLSSRDRAGSMSPVLCCGLLCGCWGSLVVQSLYPLIESPGPIEHNMLFRKLQLWTWTRITVLPCPGLCGRAGGSGIGSGHTTTWES